MTSIQNQLIDDDDFKLAENEQEENEDPQSDYFSLNKKTKYASKLSDRLRPMSSNLDSNVDSRISGDNQKSQKNLTRSFQWKDQEGIVHQPEEMLFPEMIDPNAKDPKNWKSLIQDGLVEYIRDESRNKPIIDTDEMTRTFRIDLPEEPELIQALWHNTIVYVDKKDNELVSVELSGVTDGVKKQKKLAQADEIKFIQTVQPGVLAICYEDRNIVELRNMNLDTILHIDYDDMRSAKFKGDENLKEKLEDDGVPQEINMYVAPDDIYALLVFSTSSYIVSFKLKKTPEGKFEIVELLNEPKIPGSKKEEEKDQEKASQEFDEYESINMPNGDDDEPEQWDIQQMGKGIIGYKLDTEERYNMFAMVNMHARCTVPQEQQKPPMVIPDFKLNSNAWVFPWGFKKHKMSNKENDFMAPTRSVIVSRDQGVDIKDLVDQTKDENSNLKFEESKETKEKKQILRDQSEKNVKQFKEEEEKNLAALEKRNQTRFEEEKEAREKKIKSQRATQEAKEKFKTEATYKKIKKDATEYVQKENQKQYMEEAEKKVANDPKRAKRLAALAALENTCQKTVQDTYYELMTKAINDDRTDKNNEQEAIDIQNMKEEVEHQKVQKTKDTEEASLLKTQLYTKDKEEELSEDLQKEDQLAEKARKNAEITSKQSLNRYLKLIALPREQQAGIMGAMLLENKLIIICNNDKKKDVGGCFLIDLSQEKEARPVNPLRTLTADKLDYMEISKCGRMLVMLGPEILQIWSLPDMEFIARLKVDPKGQNNKRKRFLALKVTSEHIFIKPQTIRGWMAFSLKDTKLTTTLHGTQLQLFRGHMKEVLHTDQVTLGVDVIPLKLEQEVETSHKCEKGRPLVYKVHNIDQNANAQSTWVGTWANPEEIEISGSEYGSEAEDRSQEGSEGSEGDSNEESNQNSEDYNSEEGNSDYNSEGCENINVKMQINKDFKISPEVECNQDILQVLDFHDDTVNDAWRPTTKQRSQPVTNKVFEIACDVMWKDQGWGNQKGKVKVALMRDGVEIASENLFPALAPHKMMTQKRTLKSEDVVTKSQEGDTFALFHIVGGGGGHEIEIKRFKITIKSEKPQSNQEDEQEKPKREVVTGSGRDKLGKFTLEGIIENGIFRIYKEYPLKKDYTQICGGYFQKDSFEGHWVFSDELLDFTEEVAQICPELDYTNQLTSDEQIDLVFKFIAQQDEAHEKSFSLTKVKAIECASNKLGNKIDVNEPFFKCECDDHDTTLLYSLKGGQLKNHDVKHLFYGEEPDLYCIKDDEMYQFVFGKDMSYIDFSKAPDYMQLESGKKMPEKKELTNFEWDRETRTFKGKLDWSDDHLDEAVAEEFIIKFSSDYKIAKKCKIIRHMDNDQKEKHSFSLQRKSGPAGEKDPKLVIKKDDSRHGGYKSSKGMVQVSDLQNNAFQIELLTKNEVLNSYLVKDLVVHGSVLTWMVVSPEMKCYLRQFDIKSYYRDPGQRQQTKIIRIIESYKEPPIELAETPAKFQKQLQTVVTIRQYKETRREVQVVEVPHLKISSMDGGVRQVQIKNEQGTQMTFSECQKMFGNSQSDFIDPDEIYLWQIYFYQGRAYYRFEQEEVKFKNETKKNPAVFQLENTVFDSRARTFKGSINWSDNPIIDQYGYITTSIEIQMTFDENFCVATTVQTLTSKYDQEEEEKDVEEVTLKRKQGKQNQNELVRMQVHKNLECIVQFEADFFHIDFKNTICIQIPDWRITENDETKGGSGLIVKDLQITHDCQLYQTLISPQNDTQMIEYENNKKVDVEIEEEELYETQYVQEQTDVKINDQERFGFNYEEAFLVHNEEVKKWWMSPCMQYLVLKLRDKTIYTDDYNYYVKHVSNGIDKSVFSTFENDLYEIPDMNEKNEKGLVFLGPNYFAIPNILEAEDSEDEDENDDSEDQNDEENTLGKKVENEVEGDKGYSIHRLADGKQICFLSDQNDFKFLQNSTKTINEGATVTGILDKKTSKVYEVNIRTILHLGAWQLHLNKTDPILKNELDEYKAKQSREGKLNDETIHILSLHAPALFFLCLKQFDDAPIKYQQEMMDFLVLSYPMYQTKNRDIVYENLFSYLCIKNNYQCLSIWLDHYTSVLANDEKTPISLLSKATAESVVEWLEGLELENRENILLGVGLTEMEQILKMAPEVTQRFFEVFEYIDKKIFEKIALVELQNKPNAAVAKLSDFRSKMFEKQRVHDTFFVDSEKAGGEAYEINVMMVKIQLEKGTRGSRKFLQTLVEQGEQNMEIFLFRSIQRILEFKQYWLFPVMVGYFMQYALYLVSLVVFPLFWPEDFIIVTLWLFFQIGLEYVQLTSSGKCSIADYTGIWNILDVVRIILMILYISFTIMYRVNKPDPNEIISEATEMQAATAAEWDYKRAETFTLLVLISFIGMLQYFRLLKQYRALIKMIIECTKECLTFIVVLTVLLLGFTLSTYYRQTLLKIQSQDELAISEHAFNTVMTALGDFGAQTETLNSTVLYLVFFLATIIILIVMMNLLIGIISEKLAEILEQKEKNDYFELCQLICDLENIMFWKNTDEDAEPQSYYKHFVWAEYTQMPAPWEGRVKATTAPIDRAMRAQGKELAGQNKNVEKHLDTIEQSLDNVNQDIRSAVDMGRENLTKQLDEFEVKTKLNFDNVTHQGQESKKVLGEFKQEVCGISKDDNSKGLDSTLSKTTSSKSESRTFKDLCNKVERLTSLVEKMDRKQNPREETSSYRNDKLERTYTSDRQEITSSTRRNKEYTPYVSEKRLAWDNEGEK